MPRMITSEAALAASAKPPPNRREKGNPYPVGHRMQILRHIGNSRNSPGYGIGYLPHGKKSTN
jgi:hypothetical protein